MNWAQLAGVGGTIELFAHADLGTQRDLPVPRRNGVVITFEVDDVDAAVDRLREAGVEVEAVHREEWGEAAHFFDPEGNELQVFHGS